MPSAPPGRVLVDLLGAATVTAGLDVAVYGIVRAPEAGWASGQT
ncbi:hypothetical protein [Nocardia lijiangensis]